MKANMHSNQIILASSSVYRKSLLERLRFSFETTNPNIDELPQEDETPQSLVKRLSIEKANIVAKRNPDKWIIGSDQVAHQNGRVLGKPGNHSKAFEQLKFCNSKKVEFITGVALINIEQQVNMYSQSSVKVKFLDLSEQQLNNYLKIDKPFDCAGSFKVEAMGISLFEGVECDDPTSLEGLPLITVCKLLRQAGIDPLSMKHTV